MESVATLDGGALFAQPRLRHACSIIQVDDHVPQREHLRLVAHHDLAERLHGCPARRQAWQWIMLIFSGSVVGIRVLRRANYMRVGLGDDRLAQKAIGRVRAFDDLRHKTLKSANEQTRQICQRLLHLVEGHHRKGVPDDDDADEQRDAG